jgi:ParB family chromosome partitioning protein
VREVEALVQEAKAKAERGGGVKPGARETKPKDTDTRAFEKDLSDALGLKVEVKPGSGESGMLTIEYGNFEQLDYIKLRLIGGTGY